MQFYLLVFLLSLLSAAGFAADSPAVDAAPQPTTPASDRRDQKKLPIRLKADRIEGRTGREIEASGAVEMQQGDFKLNTKELYFLEVEQEVTASGDVELENQGDIVKGDYLLYDLDSETGYMDRPQFQLMKRSDRRRVGRGDARRIEFLGPNRERLSDSRYTTCEPGQDDWFLRVKDLELDRVKEVGIARNASVEFMGVPFLYLPWVSFPLSDKRKSGLLPPVIGTSDSSGLEISVPYYWNIAPNMDATFTPRVLSKRGLQLQNEFRYLWPMFVGEMRGDILPNDRETGTNRDFLVWRHDHNFTGGWTGRLNVQRVSDDNYFRDLSTRLVDTSSTHLPRDAELRYNSEIWTFSARALSYQTLQDPDPLERIDTPYRLQPQLQLRGIKSDYNGADLSLESDLTEFAHPSKVNGQRFLIYPSVSYPFINNFSFLTPKLGYHYTRYHLTRNAATDDSLDRGLPIFSLDSGLFFERQFSYKNRPYIQTLEPRLYYVYIPFRDQSLIPNFSTTETDLNFAQIFTENQFVGGDRVNDANQLTAAVTSRFIEDETGIERLRVAVGQRYYFEQQRVTLDNPARDGNSSDILVALSGQLSRKWSVDMAWQYSPDGNRSERLSIGTRYTPAPGKVVSLAYRSRVASPALPEAINQIDLSGQWPLGRRWYGLGRLNYSLRDRSIVEGLAGVEYNANCWALRLVAHRLTTAQQQVSTSLFFQLELTGLSRLGNNPLELLKQSIPGYRTSQEITP